MNYDRKNCACPPDDCSTEIARCLAGDRTAGDRLTVMFTPSIRAMGSRILGGERISDWDDLIQTVFLRIFSKLSQFRGDCPFCPWLDVR